MSTPLEVGHSALHREAVSDLPWYRQVTREQWRAFWAVFLGWVVDSFDFNILAFIIIDIQQSFTVDRAHGVRKIGGGGGSEHEDINVHLVARPDIPDFVAARRAEGMAVDVKLLIFMGF